MRPSYAVDGNALRELTLWKAIVLSIVTIGIYFLILVYQNTKDIQASREEPFQMWPLIFWLGIFLPPLGLVNYVFNYIGVKEIRHRHGQEDMTMGLVALILSIVLAPVGQIIWAAFFNGTLRDMGPPIAPAAPQGTA